MTEGRDKVGDRYLFRQRTTVYTLPDGKYRTPDGERVTSKTPGAVKKVFYSARWYGRLPNGDKVPLAESKRTSQEMLDKLRSDARLESVGLRDRYVEHRETGLADHLEDYRRALAVKGNTPEHVQKTVRRIEAILEGCDFRRLEDLEDLAIQEYLAKLQRDGTERSELPPKKEQYTKAEIVQLLRVHPGSLGRMLKRRGLAGTGQGKARRYPRAVVEALVEELFRGTGIATCNHYLTAIKGFTRWLARKHRIAHDPLSHVEKWNEETDVRRERRALKQELFDQFIEATAGGKVFRGLGGPDRLVLYNLAAHTGLRAGELASLTPASFELEGEPPTVTVEAGYSKHRRKDVQALRQDLALMMRQYLAGKPKDQPLWPGTWKDVAAEMLRVDLAAAGIPYQDDAGRYFDFHAMRGQFISMLAAHGVHPKVAQVLARHSTITLTMDYYTHLDVLDVAGALDKLPGIRGGANTGKAAPVEANQA